MQAACGPCTRETLFTVIKLLNNKSRVLIDIIGRIQVDNYNQFNF